MRKKLFWDTRLHSSTCLSSFSKLIYAFFIILAPDVLCIILFFKSASRGSSSFKALHLYILFYFFIYASSTKTDGLNIMAISDPQRNMKGRTPWSDQEQAAVMKHLGNCVYLGTIPGKAVIENARKKDSLLAGRSWIQIKNFVRNKIVTKQKR